MENNHSSRREFLTSGLLTLALATACDTKDNPFTPEGDVELTGEKVKLLSVTGEIIEIDKAYLKPVPAGSKFTPCKTLSCLPLIGNQPHACIVMNHHVLKYVR